MKTALRSLLALALPLLALAACGGDNQRMVRNDEYGDWRNGAVRQRPLGTNAGIVIFGVDKEREERQAAAAAGGAGTGLSVNAYLWRATLDTLSFMPLASADPFGGTIITDWYSPPAAQGERFRAQAYVMGRQLRSDGVRVQIFRQAIERGQWVDSPVSTATNSGMEDQVLARARELRSQSASR
jgi:muconolactone delta-isomerase